MRHPREMAEAAVEDFLTMLATERHVSASTHNQALSALLFLYREVLGVNLPWLDAVNRPAQKRRIPSVLAQDEVAALFQFLGGEMTLLAKLLYGAGMRLMEGLRLRVKDVDFDRRVIIVREAKGNKDRVVSHAAAVTCASLAAADTKGPCAVGTRPANRARRGADAACAGSEGSQPWASVGMVLGLPVANPVGGPGHGCGAPPPFV